MGEQRLVNISIIFLGLVILVMVLRELSSFLRPFVMAIIILFLFMPVVRYCKKRKIPFFVTLGGVVVVFILAIIFIAALLSGEGSEINNSLPEHEEQINTQAEEVQSLLDSIAIGDKNLGEFIEPEKAGEIIGQIIGQVITAVTTLFSELFLVLLFLIFLLPSYERMMSHLGKNVAAKKAKKVNSALLAIERNIKEYLYTKTLISLGTAFVSLIVMWLFNTPYAFVFALLIFILNYIPNIGSFLAVAVVVGAYALINGIGLGFVFLLVCLIVVQVIFGNILEPKIAGDRLQLSPLVILLGLFLWGWIWGITGMLLAVPLMSIIKIVLEHIEETEWLAELMS